MVEGVATVVKAVTNSAELAREIVDRLASLEPCNVPNVRRLRREYSKRIASHPAASVIELALNLLKTPRIFPRFVAYELVQHHREAAAKLNTSQLESLGKGIDSWGAVDTFACYLSGPAWREGQVPDSLIKKWAHSKDRWRRRAAVVSTVALNNNARGGTGDTKRTLSVCRLVIDDRDDMIVKALSWALRELSKKAPNAVETFISENETLLAPRVLREVRNKLKTGLKNPKVY
jgi:3-methyladenine DNA glycosylase AlkD